MTLHGWQTYEARSNGRIEKRKHKVGGWGGTGENGQKTHTSRHGAEGWKIPKSHSDRSVRSGDPVSPLLVPSALLWAEWSGVQLEIALCTNISHESSETPLHKLVKKHRTNTIMPVAACGWWKLKAVEIKGNNCTQMYIRKMDKGVLKFLFHKANGTASESWGLEGIQAVHPEQAHHMARHIHALIHTYNQFRHRGSTQTPHSCLSTPLLQLIMT